MVRRRTAARKKRTAYAKLPAAAPARGGGALVVLVLGALVMVNLYVFVWDKKTSVSAIKQQALAQTSPLPGAGSGATALSVPSQPLAISAPAAPSAPVAHVAPPSHAAASSGAGSGSAIDGKVGKSDTLGRLLKKNGLSAAETDEVIHALSGVFDFRSLKAGEAYRIERGADGRLARFDLEVAKDHHVRAVRGATGALAGSADHM